MENRELMYLAENAKQKSYSPYSKFKVGAALLTKDGKIYQGANIENSSYPLTVCAEKVAFFKAISEGEKEFEKIRRKLMDSYLVSGERSDDPVKAIA